MGSGIFGDDKAAQRMLTTERTSVTTRCSVDGRRWMTVVTAHDMAERRGQELTEAASIGTDARVALLFARPGPDLEQFVAEVSRSVDVPVVGCTTAGLVTADGVPDGVAQLVVLGGPGLDAAVSAGRIDEVGPRQAGAAAAGSVLDLPHRAHSVVMLLAEGLHGNLSEVVRGAYGTAGATIPLVGGCAGDDSAMSTTHQFYDGRVLQRSVVGAAITSEVPFGVGVSHGWQPIGHPMLVTGAEGTEVLTLDDRPALDVYLDMLGEDRHFSDAASFARFAQTRPLGLQVRSGAQVRFVGGADVSRRSLQFLVPVPEGELVWVMTGDSASVLDATETATRDALSQLGGHDPLGVVAFDCVARRGILGDDRLPNEISRVRDAIGSDAPVSGFYTYGEIARQGGSLGFHHQTMVVLGLA
ncbi:MAG: FIST C-terminal domain-containing protein [Acidimicrobiales bacterium]|nr:FIST C-terminal domain-containing protein [Acidimicrobiales bacterium]